MTSQSFSERQFQVFNGAKASNLNAGIFFLLYNLLLVYTSALFESLIKLYTDSVS